MKSLAAGSWEAAIDEVLKGPDAAMQRGEAVVDSQPVGSQEGDEALSSVLVLREHPLRLCNQFHSLLRFLLLR